MVHTARLIYTKYIEKCVIELYLYILSNFVLDLRIAAYNICDCEVAYTYRVKNKFKKSMCPVYFVKIRKTSFI